MVLSFEQDNQAWLVLLSLSLVASCIGTACSMLSYRAPRSFNWDRFVYECLVRHQIIYPNFYFAILITTNFVSKSVVGALLVCLLILLSFFFLLLGTQHLKDLTDEWIANLYAGANTDQPRTQIFSPAATMAAISLGAAILVALNPLAAK